MVSRHSSNLFAVSPINTRADEVYELIIRRVADSLGLKPLRADKLSDAGCINRQIDDHLNHDAVVVADVTECNENVSLELGWRLCTGKPCVIIAERGKKLPFRITTHRVIFFNLNDVADVEACRQAICEAIEAQLKRAQLRLVPATV